MRILTKLTNVPTLEQPECFAQCLAFLTLTLTLTLTPTLNLKQPEYSKHLMFPQCLAFLDALNSNPTFVENLAYQNFRDYIHSQQVYVHSNSSNNLNEMKCYYKLFNI